MEWIKALIARNDPAALEDAFEACRALADMNSEEGHRLSPLIRAASARLVRDKGLDSMVELNRRTLLFDAPVDFDCYLRAIEWKRPAREKFYLPRRRVLRPVVSAIQKLVDGELEELFISLPPRVGKTTLLLFLVTWLVGRDSERSNLYTAYSDAITRAFYNGILEIVTDEYTYCWHDIFPGGTIARTNAQEETIDFNRSKRYASLTARSISGTLNGACDCNGVAIADDLLSGIEEALSADRLKSAWYKVDNNYIPRCKEGSHLLWCGTRWAVLDPIGRRQSLLETDPQFALRKYEVINLPALTDKDESNFEYEYGVGFSSAFYQQRRASFAQNGDIESWLAQYQGEPISREGSVFAPDTMRYYNGVLPEGTPDRIFMAVDPAYGGGDYVAAPICYQYGQDIYVPGVVYDNGDKTITQPLVEQAIVEYGVAAAQFEATKATEAYKDPITDGLRKRGISVNITTKPANTHTSKIMRIFDKAPDIKTHMVFLESGKRPPEYEQFMQNVFSFRLDGKSKHDDAPDSLAMAIDMAFFPAGRYQIFTRTF